MYLYNENVLYLYYVSVGVIIKKTVGNNTELTT